MSELFRYLRRGARLGSWPILQRYLVSKRVLELPPLEFTRKSDFGVHVRVCERDAVLLHWAVRSFAKHSKVPCALTIHDDGSCSAATLKRFANIFKGSTVISREAGMDRILTKLRDRPEIAKWWRSSYTGIKWIDYYLLGDTKHVISLDTDVLFFAEPAALFENLECAVWMKDCFYSLYVQPEESVVRFGGTPPPQLNSGLGRVPRDWFDMETVGLVFDFMREQAVLARAERLHLPTNDDQTFNAILCARHGESKYLPSSYAVAMETGLNGMVAKHYTTPTRFSLYEEGIPCVAAQFQMALPRWLKARI